MVYDFNVPNNVQLWEPEPDITAHELALCMPALLSDFYYRIEQLPDEARRHFMALRVELFVVDEVHLCGGAE